MKLLIDTLLICLGILAAFAMRFFAARHAALRREQAINAAVHQRRAPVRLASLPEAMSDELRDEVIARIFPAFSEQHTNPEVKP